MFKPILWLVTYNPAMFGLAGVAAWALLSLVLWEALA